MPELLEQAGVIVRHAAAADIDRLDPLWEALYRHQSEHGMLLTLPDGAFVAWRKSMLPFLGRFAVIIVAEHAGAILGFVAGRIRTMPPYFGSSQIGTISEVFVCDPHRGGGIGRQMLGLAVEWFQSQKITRVELQVVAGNDQGLRFYSQLGWHKELVQMVWTQSRNG
jgi:GNAT superfamily N-acetyltransferase